MNLTSIVLASAVLMLMGLFSESETVKGLLYLSSLFFISIFLVALVLKLLNKYQRAQAFSAIVQFIEDDIAAGMLVDGDNVIISVNHSAEVLMGDVSGRSLMKVFEKTFANPETIIRRLKQAAQRRDHKAQEDFATREGHYRLSVTQFDDGLWLWRVQEIEQKEEVVVPTNAQLPMLLSKKNGEILFINESLRQILKKEVSHVQKILPHTTIENSVVVEMPLAHGNRSYRLNVIEFETEKQAVYFIETDHIDVSAIQTPAQHLPVPLLRTSTEGAILSFNMHAKKFLGNKIRIGSHLEELMEGLGRPMEDWLTEVASGRAVQYSEFMRLKGKDKESFVQITLSRVVHKGDTSLIAVLTDATQIKNLEAQFVQSQKMQAIGQLAGGVAHDFNNLLTAISGHCDLLLLRHDQDDSDYNDLLQINQNASRAASLVGQLLAFSRKQTLRPEVLDMREILADLMHLLNRLVGEKVTINLKYDKSDLNIRADKRQFEQVMMNLVVNARDAMESGGEIQINTELHHYKKPLKRNQVQVPSGQYVVVQVIDEGNGIGPDKLEIVFEPFYTTKQMGEGTGLGLAMAYGIVKQSGGYIFVDSEVGKGTTFSLLFPIHEDSEPKKDETKDLKKVAAPIKGDGVVLLVEDEEPVRAFAARALSLRGYKVIEAASAEEALEILSDQTLHIDLFVTDVVMTGKDGPTWVKEALQERPNTPVVFVSGYAEDRFLNQDTLLQNSVFLPKPFSLNSLTKIVHEQLTKTYTSG